MSFNNPLAIASISLGQHSTHTLPQKITAASFNGFAAIEIVFADLEAYAKQESFSLYAAAKAVKRLCDTANLAILSLCPFENFEGNTSPLAERLEGAKKWLDIARILHATYLQVPSQYDAENSTGDEKIAIKELQALADLAAEGDHLVKISYEALAWGAYVSTWQEALRIAKMVGRENFGLCFDNFHLFAKVWGDNTSLDGKLEGSEEALRKSLQEFVRNFPMEKLFYVQISDGERFEPPYGPNHRFFVEGLDARFAWSLNARPFPLETECMGYFPMADFVRACLIEKGFKGWISFEIFDWRMRVEECGPDVAAKRAVESWRKLKSC